MPLSAFLNNLRFSKIKKKREIFSHSLQWASKLTPSYFTLCSKLICSGNLKHTRISSILPFAEVVPSTWILCSPFIVWITSLSPLDLIYNITFIEKTSCPPYLTWALFFICRLNSVFILIGTNKYYICLVFVVIAVVPLPPKM